MPPEMIHRTPLFDLTFKLDLVCFEDVKLHDLVVVYCLLLLAM